MALKSLFPPTSKPQAATAVNKAGGLAYALSPRHGLAQYAATGTLSDTFYADAKTQLETILDLCAQISDPKYVAQTAVWARKHGYMKDAPALLLCSLVAPQAVRWESQRQANAAFEAAFNHVVDNGRMLRNVVQILRSGTLGRKNLGSLPRRMISEWILGSAAWKLWTASVGNDPSLRDILRMVRPKPRTRGQAALLHYLSDSKRHFDDKYELRDLLLPDDMRYYRTYVQRDGTDTGSGEITMNAHMTLPSAPFELLLGLPNLTPADWRFIAISATWQQTRANLNTFRRHGVFEDAVAMQLIANKLTDTARIANARVLPYQLLAAAATVRDVPQQIIDALNKAVMLASGNVPYFDGRVVVGADISGSMTSPITGERGTATTAVQCVDVAALITYCVMQRSENAKVLPFTTDVHLMPGLNRSTSLTELARSFHGPPRGTKVSAPLAWLNQYNVEVDTVIIVSDEESWAETYEASPTGLASTLLRNGGPQSTQTMLEWAKLKARCPMAKLICIDLQPTEAVQTSAQNDILHVGGFSDNVWDLVSRWLRGESAATWVNDIEQISL